MAHGAEGRCKPGNKRQEQKQAEKGRNKRKADKRRLKRILPRQGIYDGWLLQIAADVLSTLQTNDLGVRLL